MLTSVNCEVIAYIALGSNLGDRQRVIEQALADLRRTPGISVLAVSSLLENPAINGPADSPAFLNGVAELQTTLSPQDLMDVLLNVESLHGRIRSIRNAPRTIDLDLLLYGELVISTPQLTLPHPRLHERRFVLQPLIQIAPTLRLPNTGPSLSDLLANLDPSDG